MGYFNNMDEVTDYIMNYGKEKVQKPEVTRRGLLNMQVCVPKAWTDEQATDFANTHNPSGIHSRWRIEKEGDVHLAGSPERVQCEEKADFIHIMLDC